MERLPLHWAWSWGILATGRVADLGREELGRLASQRWRPPPRTSPVPLFGSPRPRGQMVAGLGRS